MKNLDTLLAWDLWNNTGQQWLAALVVATGFLLLFFVIKPLAIARLARLAGHTRTAWDDAVIRLLGATKSLALLIFALTLGSLVLTLPDEVRTFIVRLAMITLIVQAGL